MFVLISILTVINVKIYQIYRFHTRKLKIEISDFIDINLKRFTLFEVFKVRYKETCVISNLISSKSREWIMISKICHEKFILNESLKARTM